MTAGAGLRRSASSLAEAAGEIDELSIDGRTAGLSGIPTAPVSLARP